MAKPTNPLLKAPKTKSRFRANSVALITLTDTGVIVCNHNSAMITFIKEEDEEQRKTYANEIIDDVESNVDVTPFIRTPTALIAVSLIETVNHYDTTGDTVIQNSDRQAFATFTKAEFPNTELLMDEINKAIETAGHRDKHKIDWEALMASNDAE